MEEKDKIKEIEDLNVRDRHSIERIVRLYRWAKGIPQNPFKIVITPTDRCNFNCIFCPNYTARKSQRFKSSDELTKDEWIDLVKHGVDLNVIQWCVLGGGEPLLRSEILLPALDIICEKSKTIDFEIITNGSLLTNDFLEEAIKINEGKKDGFFQITMSIHGLKNTYHSLTNFDGFDIAIKNLKVLRDLKNKYNTNEPIVQVNILLNKMNLNEILDLVKVISELKVDVIAFHALRSYEETKDKVKNIELTEDDLRDIKLKMFDEAVKIAKKNNVEIGTLPIDAHITGLFEFDRKHDSANKNLIAEGKLFLENIHNVRCYEPWYDILINSDGQVARCAAFSTRREPINIRNQSLKEIWFGNFFNQVRKNVVLNMPMEGCERCGLLTNTSVLREHFEKYHDVIKLKFKDIGI